MARSRTKPAKPKAGAPPPVRSSPAASSGSPAARFDAVAQIIAQSSEPTHPVPWHHVGRQQLAELMGVHPDSVTDFTKQGMPVVVRGGHGKESTYDAVACLAWWRQRQGRDSKETAQARAANASALLNEMKAQKERAELIPRDQVELAGQAVVKQWATVVRGLPRRMTQAGIIPRAQESAVTKLCADLSREIAAWRPLPPKVAR